MLLSRIRERGPITVAEFMELALYHPEHGYYSTAPQRSGKHGDFFTSVDVGPLFGELIAVQLEEMWRLLEAAGAEHFDLVEAGANVNDVFKQLTGLGRSLVTALIERDIIVVQNLVLLYAVIFVLVNFVVDLSYAWLDPRIRYA